MKLILFDTETTGIEKKDRLCQLAYTSVDLKSLELVRISRLYKPSVPITIDAMAVHHITEKMLAYAPQFKECQYYKKVKELFENKENIVVAHNAKFDIDFLKREDIHIKKSICTLKIARYLDADGAIPSYKLQYLRYYLGIDIDAKAHDASGDVAILEELLSRLFKKFIEKNNVSEIETYNQMVIISSKPVAIARFAFGKHKGEKIADVAVSDKSYLSWLFYSEQGKDEPDEDMVYTLKKYI